MSSIVENSVSGGVDLNSLTSGERWLIGMLNQPIVTNESEVAFGCDCASISTYSNGYFNFSKVSSIDMEVVAKYSGSNYFSRSVYINNFTGTQIIVGRADFTQTSLSATLTCSGTRTTAFIVFPGFVSGFVEYRINSFTTTDGKVHTASNLNY